MKNLLNKSIYTTNPEKYLSLLIFIVPILNFLPGFTFDLYSPSMPALAHYFSASNTVIKNTVTATLIGFPIGALFSGVLLDTFGRRRTILFALLLYAIVSISAIFCKSVDQFILTRFFQGILIAVVSTGCRAIIVDNFSGHRFRIAMLYTSLTYGLGPIIGPFFGGILQHHFGWKANFLAYGIIGIALFLLFAVYVDESLQVKENFSIKRSIKNYQTVLSNNIFIVAILLVSFCQIEVMLYSTVGAFIVENILHRTAIVFGNTALLVGCCYLIGTLTNRFFIKKYSLYQLTKIGLILLAFGSVVQIIFAYFGELNLFNLVFPTMIICYSQGFIFPNVLARCLKLFPRYAGIATSALSGLRVLFAGFGMFIISHIDVDDLFRFTLIFAVMIIIQLVIFFGFYKKELIEV